MKYLELPTYLCTVRLFDYNFYEKVFLTLGGERKQLEQVLVRINYHYLVLIFVQKNMN